MKGEALNLSYVLNGCPGLIEIRLGLERNLGPSPQLSLPDVRKKKKPLTHCFRYVGGVGCVPYATCPQLQ